MSEPAIGPASKISRTILINQSQRSSCMPMRSAGGLGMPHPCPRGSSLRSSLCSFLDPCDHVRLDPVVLCEQASNLQHDATLVLKFAETCRHGCVAGTGLDIGLDLGLLHSVRGFIGLQLMNSSETNCLYVVSHRLLFRMYSEISLVSIRSFNAERE